VTRAHFTLGSLLLAITVVACGRSEAAPAATVEPVAVTVATVGSVVGAQTITAVGTLGAKDETPLAFKIGGVVQRVNAEPGMRVKAGAVLAELASTEIAAEVEKAKQGRAKAERDLARAKALYRDSVATLEQLQDATTAFEVAESNVKIAEFNRQYAVVRAPSDGVVLKRGVEASQLVGPGQLVVLFRSEGRGMVLRAGLPDRDAVRVRVGDAATVKFDAYPGETFRGRVAQVAVGATGGSGTYEIEVALDGARALASGLVGRVELQPRGGARVPSVPAEAVLEADGDSATVFVLAPDGAHAQRRRVRVGALSGDQLPILSGLDAGAQVIVAGASWVRDGGPVKQAKAGTTK
jgi:RND family efflux transporter MFP subunit